ncbi:MAG: PorV/PorQ family protein [Candidatus Eisenbacteria sp.]|nr:PorV/PorQ family protein [Candidatus Eisenbacteria bacterium]
MNGKNTVRQSPAIRGLIPLRALAAVAAVLLASVPAAAQTDLGGQRVGTSAATFLEIGVGARGAAMGGAFVCIADDATSAQWNPAGLVRVRERQAIFSLVDWPADITYSHVCLAYPVAALDGTIGLQFGSLGAEMKETTEYFPDGTGRNFTFSDWVAGVSFAKRFTDKFSGGMTLKFIREGLGTEIGGPTMSSWLVDAGTWYDVGYGSLRLGVALLNFGPELRPDGHYQSRRPSASNGPAGYESFSPPMTFKAGIAIDPIQRPGYRLTTVLEMNHPADNVETLIFGGELWIGQTLALRAGYDTNADELNFSTGFGLMATLGSVHGTLDYAYTSGEYLGRIDRLSVGLRF